MEEGSQLAVGVVRDVVRHQYQVERSMCRLAQRSDLVVTGRAVDLAYRGSWTAASDPQDLPLHLRPRGPLLLLFDASLAVRRMFLGLRLVPVRCDSGPRRMLYRQAVVESRSV